MSNSSRVCGDTSTRRLIFDAYWWTEGPESNRQVMRSIIKTWRETHPDDSIFLAIRHADYDVIRKEFGQQIPLLRLRAPIHGLAIAIELPFKARRIVGAMVFCHNFTPIFGNASVFIHDVLFQTNSQWFTWIERAYLATIPLLARRADRILTSSKSEAARIGRANPKLGQAHPVGLAVHRQLIEAQPIKPVLPAWFKADTKFCLTVSRLNVRKNLKLLLDTWENPHLTPPLMIVGEASGKREDHKEQIARLIGQRRIHFLGFVSEAELRWLYEHASLFLFPSLDEGFGLPPLEAQTFGSQVLATDTTVFREILSDSTGFFEPNDPQALAEMISQQLAHPMSPRSSPNIESSWLSVIANIRATIWPDSTADHVALSESGPHIEMPKPGEETPPDRLAPTKQVPR